MRVYCINYLLVLEIAVCIKIAHLKCKQQMVRFATIRVSLWTSIFRVAVLYVESLALLEAALAAIVLWVMQCEIENYHLQCMHICRWQVDSGWIELTQNVSCFIEFPRKKFVGKHTLTLHNTTVIRIFPLGRIRLVHFGNWTTECITYISHKQACFEHAVA